MADLLMDAPRDGLLALPETHPVPDFSIYTAPMEPGGAYPYLSEIATALVKQDQDTLLHLPRPTLTMVGSSAERDLQGDIMAQSALSDMTHVPSNLALWLNHDYTVPGSYLGGLIGTPRLLAGRPFVDLALDAGVELINPDAARTYLMIQRGARLGCSVGCLVEQYEFVNQQGETVDAASIDPYDMVFGSLSLRVLHVRVVEWSVVGIPANQRSWVENALKGVFARTLDPRLAPTVRSLWPHKYEDLVLRSATSSPLADRLLNVRPRVGVNKRIWWQPLEKRFFVENGRSRQALEREDLAALFDGPEMVDALPLVSKSASDSDQAAYEARSKKYHIGCKKGGNVTKPGEWASVPDSEFGDPVNYRYPCHDKAHADNAASRWADATNHSQYSADEQQIIGARIAARQRSFGETPDETKALPESQVVTKMKINTDGSHAVCSLSHSHAHPAYGGNQKEGFHSHQHDHIEDADHQHLHEGLTPPTDLEDHPGAKPGGSFEDHPGDRTGMSPGGMETHPGQTVKAAMPAASGVSVASDGSHPVCKGVHTHAHKAYGFQPDGKGFHSHPHPHDGEADHSAHDHGPMAGGSDASGGGDADDDDGQLAQKSADLIAERLEALKNVALAMGLSWEMVTKSGRTISAKNLRHAQIAHDALNAMTSGKVCGIAKPSNDTSTDGDDDDDDNLPGGPPSKGPLSPRQSAGGKTVQQAADEAAQERAISREGYTDLVKTLERLALAMEELTSQEEELTKSLTAGSPFLTETTAVLSPAESQLTATQKQLNALETQAAALRKQMATLQGTSVGRPTQLNRQLTQDPAAARWGELTPLQTQRRQRQPSLDEALDQTELVYKKGLGTCRLWPDSLVPNGGRPALTPLQLSYMSNDDVLNYSDGKMALVPEPELA